MKYLKRIVANTLACVLLFTMFTTSIAYAGMQAGSNESGGGGYIKPTGNKVMKANGVIFGLEVTSNTTTESEKDIIKEQQAAAEKTAGKVYFDEIGATIVDNYLYHYPDFLCDVNITNRYALIIRDTYNSASKLNVNKQFMVGGSNGLKSEAPFNKVYRCANKGTSPAYTLDTLVSRKLSSEQQKAFLKGELSFDVVREKMSVIKADYDKAASAFVKQFVNMGTLGDHLNSILTYDNSEKDLLTYLDFVTLIYYMTGQNAHSEYAVKTYLKNLNADGSDSFVTLFIASVVSLSEDNNPAWDWYTLPNYYSYASGASVDRYQNIVYSNVTKRKAVEQKTTSPNAFTATTEKAWIADFFKQYEGVKTLNKDGALRSYSNANRIFMWWSENQYSSAAFDNWKSATMLMPTDMWGHKTGTLGFTYFNTSGVQQTTDREPRGNIQLYIDGSKNNAVEKPGTKTSATVVIDLTSEKKQRGYTEKTFEYAKKNNVPVRVTIQLSAKTIDGTPDNVSNFDTLLIPAGLTINSSKKIVWENVTWEEFEPYMLGEKVMKWNDSDITINDATKIGYYATLTIDVVESPIKITGKFNGVGEESNSDKYTAQTSWTCTPGETPPDPTDPEPPKTGSFHSTMEQPYVEIKEGTPGNETFEAMAGVPTNRNLYVSFGASEFMLNLEVEMKTGDESQRTYKLTFTAENCYDTDELCKYECDGHEYNGCPNGCGAYTCGKVHTHTAECSKCTTGIPTPYNHKDGAKTITSKCSCGRLTSAPYQVIPTWGDGCENSCTAGGTKCYTGMGCYPVCHETKGDANKAHNIKQQKITHKN